MFWLSLYKENKNEMHVLWLQSKLKAIYAAVSWDANCEVSFTASELFSEADKWVAEPLVVI